MIRTLPQAPPRTLPLALPRTLVDTHRIDLTAPYSTGWSVKAQDVVAAPGGDVYALYGVHRHTHGVAEDEPDPAKADFGYRIITWYSADGEVLAGALCCPSSGDGETTAVAGGSDMTLCVLPDGTLALGAHPDSTTLIAPDLSRVLATYDAKDERPFEELTSPGDGFAGSIAVTPSGRLLCANAEYGVWNYGNPLAGLVGLAAGGLSPTTKPVIEAIAALDPSPTPYRADDRRAHLQYRGAPVGPRHRPEPALTELLADEDRLSHWHDSRLGRPVPLAEDLFVVPVYAGTFRGGSRGQPFVFALVDDRGTMTGRLHGLHPWHDSPFTGFCFNLAADPHRGHAFHLNRYGLYAWNKAGVLRAKLDTTVKEFKPLAHFTLTTCSPEGELLLVHRKQHLVLRVPVPEDLGALAPAVEAALRAYTRQRTALKKRYAPVNWHWTHTAPVHRL
ncbi:hypothetical protein [Streptomyces sp. NPDC007088]|uniref:hypothetical protein n=1 Tax=Streptomyces sp. NPDC007088 TaxID=3364773 RepID=UPI0036A3C3F7